MQYSNGQNLAKMQMYIAVYKHDADMFKICYVGFLAYLTSSFFSLMINESSFSSDALFIGHVKLHKIVEWVWRKGRCCINKCIKCHNLIRQNCVAWLNFEIFSSLDKISQKEVIIQLKDMFETSKKIIISTTFNSK